MTEDLARRIATIVALLDKAPGKRLGRTAVMKLLYFLTVIRGCDLGYRFSLYSYGPFDSEVLQALDYASTHGFVKSKLIGYPSGYGYEIERGQAASRQSLDPKFVKRHQADINWVMNEFGNLGAADLELTSTIIYVDRESEQKQTMRSLAKRVRDVKPHFSMPKTQAWIVNLVDKGLLLSVHDKNE